MNNAKIAPSILSGNFADLGCEIKDLSRIGADLVHIDVMDGVFVPNITFGFKMIKDLRPLSDLFFDVHLMITEPHRYVERFVQSGANSVSFHIEAEPDVDSTIAAVKTAGAKVGLAFNPDTPVEKIERYISKLDFVLIMSVFPGFGGQKFIEGSLERIKKAAEIRDASATGCLIEVDGGINAANSKEVIAAGADIIVAGNAVFGADDRAKAVSMLRGK